MAEVRALLAAATPRPWFVVGRPWNQGEPWINAESEDPHGGRYVCEFDSNSIADIGDENLAADAALIVAAVNEYEALLDVDEAARQLVRRDIPIGVVALCEANLLAALASLDGVRGAA